MKKTKPDILADIKYKSGEPADYAIEELPMAVLTVIGETKILKMEES
jgi:hypothetical protein